MIELLKEVWDRLRLTADPDTKSLCGFSDEDLREAPVVEFEE